MFEAYKIGVKLTLINHVSHGLNAIIGHFGQTNASATALQGRLKQIKLMAIAGTAMGAGGFMGLGLIAKTIDPASKYVHQLALMNQSGMKHLEIVNATKASWDAIKSVPTSSVTENMEAIRDLRMVFGDTAHAVQYMPTLQKIQGILGSVRHGEGSAKSESYELAKALEMKGAVKTPEQFVGQADMITKAIIATGGKVGASDFLSAFKYGRAATSGWDDKFAYTILPTLIQEMKSRGGSGAAGGPGSSLMSMYAAVVGGTLTQRSLAVWQKLGLLDSSKIIMTKDGHAKGVAPGGIAGSEIFQRNPYQWTREVLMPAMMKAGMTTEEQQKQTLQYLFPNRTAGFVASQFATQAWKFERDAILINQAKGLGGYNELLKNDPMMAKMALAKQWEGLLASIGYNLMPAWIKGLTYLTDKTISLIGWIRENEKLVKVLTWGFIGVSTALAGAGLIITLGAAAQAIGLVVGAIGGVGGLVSILSGPLGLVAALAVAAPAIAKFVGWLWDNGDPKKNREKSKDYHGWDFGSAGAGREIKFSRKSSPDTIKLHIDLDGKPIYNNVVNRMDKAASGAQRGTSLADYMLHPIPVGG